MGNPWDGEPEEGTTGEYLGFHWETMKHRLQPLGWNWNGYVDIPEGHPYFEGYENPESRFDPESLDVHGGITWMESRTSKDGSKVLRVGFDTGHSCDAYAEPDPEYVRRYVLMNEHGEFRTHAYVVEQIKILIHQLTEAGMAMKLAEG